MGEWETAVEAANMAVIEFVLTTHVGKENAISRKKLLSRVPRLTDRKLRLAINQMRNEGHLICSRGGVGGGYWMAETYAELTEFIESELKSRAYDMLRTAKRMDASGVRKLTQQIGLILGDEV